MIQDSLIKWAAEYAPEISVALAIAWVVFVGWCIALKVWDGFQETREE